MDNSNDSLSATLLSLVVVILTCLMLLSVGFRQWYIFFPTSILSQQLTWWGVYKFQNTTKARIKS